MYPESDRFITRKQLETLIGLSRSTIYAKITPFSGSYDPEFPKPRRIGARAVRWSLNEVNVWLATLPTTSG